MQEEIWADVVGYEGRYQISTMGRVKSLSRKYSTTETILKGRVVRGYLAVSFGKNKIFKTLYIHKLVAITFLGHTPCMQKEVVDHINGIKTDNILCNIQLLSSRNNTCKSKIMNGSSKYIGVSWCKVTKRWKAQICINGKGTYIGIFKNELDARKAYLNKLSEIKS